MPQPTMMTFAATMLRLALAAAFLSAVADRFGLWGAPGTGEVAWGTFDNFVQHTALLLWFAPAAAVKPLAWAATVIEVVLAIGLCIGVWPRLFACVSGLLLLSFALTMTFGTGAEGALSYSVWTAAAAAFLLATLPSVGAERSADVDVA